MLQKNPLQPPRPFSAASRSATTGPLASDLRPDRFTPLTGYGFLTPEDFDSTGILSGVDPSEPEYWWMPELHARGTTPDTVPEAGQAACRSTDRSVAAA
jgi:hypothetical protein